MPRIRRTNLPKGTFFVTCVTHNRMSWFANELYAQIVVDQLRYYEYEYEFKLHVYCVMPDHYHAVLSEGSTRDLSQILHG